jgi:DNA-binding winged helix-turn-helix (wHTH) protein
MMFTFAGFTYDAENGCFYGEQRIALSRLESRLLGRLVGAAGHVVTKNALAAHAWQGTPVSDESIARAVHLVRRKLRAHSEVRIVETVYAQGYRVATPVRRIAAEPSTTALAGTSALTVAIACLRDLRETLRHGSSADLGRVVLQVEHVERLLAQAG